LNFSEKSISGDLLAGQITVLSASQSVNMTTLDGKSTKLNAGESMAAGKSQDDDDDDDDDGGALILWGLIVGGAVALIIYAATRGNNDIILGGNTNVILGGNTNVVSPSR
jgi:hypothetical protein